MSLGAITVGLYTTSARKARHPARPQLKLVIFEDSQPWSRYRDVAKTVPSAHVSS